MVSLPASRASRRNTPAPSPDQEKLARSQPARIMAEVSRSKKQAILVLLVIQNSMVILLTRYSKGVIKEKYLPSTVVLCTEILKLVIAFGLAYSNRKQDSSRMFSYFTYIIRNSGYTWLPAACYCIQNTLQYVALENLPSSVYAVLQQLKILSAGVASFLFLNKTLSLRKWRALILLVIGGALIEHHGFNEEEKASQILKSSNTSNLVKGSFAMFVLVSLSGIAGVLTEKFLKNAGEMRNFSIWERNVQLATFSIISASLGVMTDYDAVRADGFFQGWSRWTVISMFLWCSGGFLVAMTIKYTDVIVKGFASAISLICISVLGGYLLGDSLDAIFFMGACITIIATFNYNERDGINVAPAPKVVS